MINTHIPLAWHKYLSTEQWQQYLILNSKKLDIQKERAQKNKKRGPDVLKQYKGLLKLNAVQKMVIAGLALGDGHLCLRGTRIKHYALMVENKQPEYVMFLYAIFEPWVLTPPFKTPGKETYRFSTISHPAFDFFGKAFYGGKVKGLPKNLHKFLREPALAIWFMDDGSRKGKDRMGLHLNTQCFTKDEHSKLVKALKRVGLESSFHKQIEGSGHVQYRIYMGGHAEMKLRKYIAELLLPCFAYKLPAIKTKKYLKAPVI